MLVEIGVADSRVFDSTPLEQTLLPQLHAVEQARYRNFSHPRRRRMWLAGRALLLALLQRREAQFVADSLRTDVQGGVCCTDDTWQLSLSHSRGTIAVSVARTRVGVDIECLRDHPALRHPAAIFSTAEAAELQALTGTTQQDAFFRLWTLKEAACKASGRPLLEALRELRFTNGKVQFTPAFPPGTWYFMSARLEAGWRLALALQGQPQDISCWRLDAGQHWQAEPLHARDDYHGVQQGQGQSA